MTVALPTSCSCFARPEMATAPSMPTNTQMVIIMVPADLFPERQGGVGAGLEVLHEDGRIELLQEDDGRDGHEDGGDLADGNDGVHAGHFLDAARHQKRVEPHER